MIDYRKLTEEEIEILEVSKDFFKHSGVYNATLRNVSVGDNCLIENIGNFINNYTIGNECYISNVCTMETTEGATYGEGNLVSVLNEVGDGNVVIFSNLNSQFAAFMVKHFRDKEVKDAIRRLVDEDIKLNMEGRHPPSCRRGHQTQYARARNDWKRCQDCEHQGNNKHHRERRGGD